MNNFIIMIHYLKKIQHILRKCHNIFSIVTTILGGILNELKLHSTLKFWHLLQRSQLFQNCSQWDFSLGFLSSQTSPPTLLERGDVTRFQIGSETCICLQK